MTEPHRIALGGHAYMQIWSAYCSCGWSTVQRDPQWRKQKIEAHLAPPASGATDA